MRKQKTLLLFLITLCCISVAQNKKDSLLNVLQHAQEDTNRVNLLAKLSSELKNNEPDKSLQFATEGLELAIKLSFKKGMGDAFTNLGTCNIDFGDYPKAEQYFQKALKIFTELGNGYQNKIAHVNTLLAKLNSHQGYYDLALKYRAIALEIYTTISDTPNIARVYIGIGNDNCNKSNYSEAINFYFKAQKIQKKLPKETLAQLYYSLGYVYAILEKSSLALKYYLKSVELNKELGNKRAVAEVYINIGGIYHSNADTNNMALAKDYFNMALTISEDLKNEKIMAYAYLNLSSIYVHKMEFYQALDYSSKALLLVEKMKDYEGVFEAYSELANIYLKEGKNYLKALEYAHKGLSIAKKLESLEYQMASYEVLYIIYEKQNNYKNAYEYFTKYYVLEDSVKGIEKTKQIYELEAKYLNENKTKEIELLSKKNEIQKLEINKNKYIIYASIVGFLLFVIIVILIWQRNKSRTEQKAIELEQKLLLAQMNPHFLFNALNSIQSCILHEDKMIAYDHHTKFAKLIRMILEFSREKYISIKDELEAVRMYIDLEVLRTDRQFDYEIIIEPGLDINKYKIPPMLIQPYVENAIWHGIMNKDDGKGKLTIKIMIAEEKLKCIVEDNGIGRERSKLIKQQRSISYKSLGMTVTQERMSLYNLSYRKKLKIDVIDINDAQNNSIGTRVECLLPLIGTHESI